MSRQPLNFVVLGGSFAGLSIAHYFLDHIIHELGTFEDAPTYRVILISPSTHLFWNICAPRALVSPNLIDPEHAFVPIEPAFSRHPFNEFTFIQGWATAVDTSARKITIETSNPRDVSYRPTSDRHGKYRTIPYHALVIATGSSHRSPLYSLHGIHEETLAEMRAFHARLQTANSIFIVGGGPSGVETAGQLAIHFNKKNKLRKLLSPRKPKTITLISGGSRLLPRLNPKTSKKAERQLKNLGVHVVHNLRQLSSTVNTDGSSNCILNNDMTITSDLLIQATGVYPNTRFLPPSMLDEAGYVATDRETLRILGPSVGDRIYAVGDCAAYSKNYILDVYEPIPSLMKNLQNDLLAHEYRLQTIEALEDAHFHQNPTDTQLMPITRFGGVGVAFGWRVPSFMVWVIKRRDYAMGKAKGSAERGANPFAVK
ncbi:hypothetical protein BDV96DRAFT_548444 [Lophiotrema nucula]|uniref:FAD/NAD(P)-binding domain-containing protein n=1 Tax=Lophiotrema nucula TaxID=690887 RepID=A0A6A5Z5C0_9PLEO|nr:hypothetical protein BDV96DRAFT_548444 [Lophiotrema nucula]